MQDLDQSGNPEQRIKAYLGPSLGWKDVIVNSPQTITAAGAVTLPPGSNLVLVDVAGLVTLNLPDVVSWVNEVANQPATGFERAIIIKDLGGNAGNFPITVTPFSSQKIDGVAGNLSINIKNQVLNLIPLKDMSGWVVLSQSGALSTFGRVITVTGTMHVLQPTDNGATLVFTNATPVTLTVPMGLQVGFVCRLIQLSGQVTVSPSMGVSLNSYNGQFALGGQYAVADLNSDALNAYVLSGNLGGPGLASFVGLVPSQFNILTAGRNFTPVAQSLQGNGNTWDINNTTVTGVNTVTGPDGVLSGQKVIEDSTTGNHAISGPGGSIGFPSTDPGSGAAFKSSAAASPIKMRAVAIAQASTRTRIVLRMGNAGSSTTAFASAGFDLAGGIVFDTAHDAAWSVPTTSMTSLGDGWWMCLIDSVNSDAEQFGVRINIFLDSGSGAAARNISYAGNGTSGVNLWFASFLPTAAWAIASQTFFDDFLDTSGIDLNDTRAPGFNWYTHNLWPAANNLGQSVEGTPTPAGFISTSNSILELSQDSSGYGSGIMTAAANPSDPTLFVGRVFGPSPLIYEAKIAYEDRSGPDQLGPTWWSMDIKILTTPTPSIGPVAIDGGEIDVMEMGIHQPHGNLGCGLIGSPPDSSTGAPTKVSFYHVLSTSITDFHRYATLVMSPASNDGSHGGQMFFQDGAFVGQSWSGWPGSGVNNFSVLSTDRWALILGAGGFGLTPWPNFVDYVRVFQ